MAGLTYEELMAQGAKPVEQAQPQEPGIGSRIGADYMRRGQDIVSDVKRPAELASQGASPWRVGGAVLEAGLRTVGNVAGAAFDPIAEALSPVVKPVIQKISQIPGVAGGVQAASDWATKHPEAAKDLGAVFNIATLPLGGAAEVGAKGALEAGTEAVGKVASPVGKALKGAGEAAYGLTIPMEESTRLAQQSFQANQGSFLNRVKGYLTGTEKGVAPITEANTAARYGLTGTEWELGVQAKQTADKIWEKTLAPKLAPVKNITNMKQFINDLGDEIVKNTPELGRKNSLLEALDAFAEDYKNVGTIGAQKLQDYKSGWAQFIPEATYKGKPIGSALKDVKNMAAGKARQMLYDAVGADGKMAYIDYGNLQSIEKAGIKSMGDMAKKSFTRNVWEAVMNKLVTPVATMSGKVLYRTGEGLEFVGDIGAKKVGDIIKGSPNMLEAGANLTKDMPMGLSIKDVSKGAIDQFDESIKRVMKDVQTSDPELWMVADDYIREPNIANKQRAIEEFKLKGIDLAEPTTQFTPDQAKLPNLKGKKANLTMGEIDPLLSEARKGEYLYHGTSESAFENIQKEGIKPQRRGVTSLSKSEDYSKNWAFPEATKTQGVMLRVKADAVKTIPSKSGVPSDKLNELLTKEVISPKDIEVFKNGKWQPLVQENSLLSEARKYKSAEEFVKSIDNVEELTGFYGSSGVKTETGKPVIIKGYHGTDKQFDKFAIPKEGVRYTGDGVYFYPTKESAIDYISRKKNGRVIDSYLDLKKPYNWYPETTDAQLGKVREQNIKSQGYDSIIVRFRDVDDVTGKLEADLIREVVVFDTNAIKTKSQLTDIWNKANK